MKFLLCLSVILLITFSSISSFQLKQINQVNQKEPKETESSYILKLNENYYNKIGHERIDEFKNMIFRELDQKTIWDKHLNSISGKEYKDYKENINIIVNSTNKTIDDSKSLRHSEGLNAFAGEYLSTNRIIKFYISHVQECSIFVNDTVNYENINNVNFVEHMILHNNAEVIDPKGVYSDDVNINFFAFNRKLNIFSVYFESKQTSELKGKLNPHKNFTVEYDYDALNIIKSNIAKDNENTTSSSNKANSNSFIWKILNQNFIKSSENVTIEMYFDLGKEFQHEDVEFSLNFTKSILNDEKKNIVKYEWMGVVHPQEVIVLQAKFPLYFEHCENLSINLVMIFVGAVFIIFLIGMLYIILSTVFTEDIF